MLRLVAQRGWNACPILHSELDSAIVRHPQTRGLQLFNYARPSLAQFLQGVALQSHNSYLRATTVAGGFLSHQRLDPVQAARCVSSREARDFGM